jgi:hypothetical protein
VTRAPVQGDGGPLRERKHGPGTISWEEHERAWAAYARVYGRSQSAQRIAERGGFCYAELVEFLGHEPQTWEPR